MPAVDLIHRIEIIHALQIDRGLHHLVEAAAGRFQQCLQVFHHLRGLRGDISLHKIPRRRINGDLPGNVNPTIGADHRRVRTNGLGRMWRRNGFFHSRLVYARATRCTSRMPEIFLRLATMRSMCFTSSMSITTSISACRLLVLASMLRMLVCWSLITAVICFSMPKRSSQKMLSLIGYVCRASFSLASLAHSTAMRRSVSYIR